MNEKEMNNSIYLGDSPRVLQSEFRLCRMLDLHDAVGTWNGIRPDEFEIAIRISCKDPVSKDCQDGIADSLPFPHVYIKKPRSDYYSGTFSPRKAFVLIYRGADFPKFCRLGWNSSCLAWKITLTPEIRHLIRELKKNSFSLHLRGTPDRMDGLAGQLVRELLLQNQQMESSDPDEIRIRQAASWLTRHYPEKIDLDCFFIQFGFSRRNFYRHWEKVFHEPPKTFLRNLRLQEAERLLGFHSFSIEDIAWKLHFRDVSHFIRIFRERTGSTPLQYRKKISRN